MPMSNSKSFYRKNIKAKFEQVKLPFKNRPHIMSLRHEEGISFMGGTTFLKNYFVMLGIFFFEKHLQPPVKKWICKRDMFCWRCTTQNIHGVFIFYILT